MAKKRDVRSEFRLLLAPTIIRALRDDVLGKILLMSAQRRELRKLLRIGMSSEEIRAALAGARRARPPRRPRQR